jgi:hypothetical protein
MIAAYIAHQRAQPFIRLYTAIEDSVAASSKEVVVLQNPVGPALNRSARVQALSATLPDAVASRPVPAMHSADVAAGVKPESSVRSVLSRPGPDGDSQLEVAAEGGPSTGQGTFSPKPVQRSRQGPKSSVMLRIAKARVAYVSVDYNLFESAFLITSVGSYERHGAGLRIAVCHLVFVY